MIGQIVRSHPRFPWVAWLFLLVAAGLIGLAVVAANPHPAIGALLPLFLGIVLWSGRERSMALEFAEQTIEVVEPPSTVRYDGIEGLRAPKRPRDPAKPGPRSYAIDVLHREGILRIPKYLDAASDDVFFFLHQHLTPCGARDLNPALADYLEQQINTFGADKVWSYRARAHFGSGASNAGVVGGVFAVTGILWIIAPVFGRSYDPWAVAGAAALVLGAVFLVVTTAANPKAKPPGIKKWRESGLVISPSGLAMVQGDLKGELKWAELKDVRYQPGRPYFQLTGGSPLTGIVLVLEGAKIAIANIYDRPLRMIHERILQYWR
jgi:hypothetical protein